MTRLPKKVTDLAKKIENEKKINFLHSNNWRNDIPSHPGVYIIWRKSGTPIYIGETSNLKDRFADLHQTAHHTFRRHVLKARRKKGKQPTGRELSAYISKNYTISYLKISFGRIELEEYLIYKWRNNGTFLYNRVQKRIYKNTLYNEELKSSE